MTVTTTEEPTAPAPCATAPITEDASETAATRPRPFEVAYELRSALRTAGLHGLSVDAADLEASSRILLGSLDSRGALKLAALVRESMRPLFTSMTVLRTALGAHDLEAPQLDVREGRVCLGSIAVDTADRLADALDAPPSEPETDIEEWPGGQVLVDRLAEALRSATGGGLPDVYYHPYCARCRTDPAVEVGPMTAAGARGLASALRVRG